MKLVRYGEPGNERPGVWLGDDEAMEHADILDVRAMIPEIDDFDAAFFASGGIRRIQKVFSDATSRVVVSAHATRLGPPVRCQGSILCLGKNYLEHAKEFDFDSDPPDHPIVFAKALNAVCGPYDSIGLTPEMREVDGEVELAAVIGRAAYRVTAANALSHVAGYLILNDITDRAAQRADGQWCRAKSADTFCPLGPFLVTADAIDAGALAMRSRLNDMPLQDGNTADMMFRLPETIAFISQSMTLRPGDLISTGTPSGIGSAHTPPRFLKAGDILETAIAGLGRQRNPAADVL